MTLSLDIQQSSIECHYAECRDHLNVLLSVVAPLFGAFDIWQNVLASIFPLSALGFQQFLSQDSDVTLEIVDEGKEHIKREKRRLQRLIESQSRCQ
jgi:hypothetical protein